MGSRHVKLGDLVRDSVSGLEGIVVGVSIFLHGCSRVGLQPRELHEGLPVDAYWIDEPQAELVQRAAVPVGDGRRASTSEMIEARRGDTGGPMPSTPTRTTYATYATYGHAGMSKKVSRQ